MPEVLQLCVKSLWIFVSTLQKQRTVELSTAHTTKCFPQYYPYVNAVESCFLTYSSHKLTGDKYLDVIEMRMTALTKRSLRITDFFVC